MSLNNMKKAELVEMVTKLQGMVAALSSEKPARKYEVSGNTPVATFFNVGDAWTLRNRIAAQRTEKAISRSCFIKAVHVHRFGKDQVVHTVVA